VLAVAWVAEAASVARVVAVEPELLKVALALGVVVGVGAWLDPAHLADGVLGEYTFTELALVSVAVASLCAAASGLVGELHVFAALAALAWGYELGAADCGAWLAWRAWHLLVIVLGLGELGAVAVLVWSVVPVQSFAYVAVAEWVGAAHIVLASMVVEVFAAVVVTAAPVLFASPSFGLFAAEVAMAPVDLLRAVFLVALSFYAISGLSAVWERVVGVTHNCLLLSGW
jgi:hypothetical protein